MMIRTIKDFLNLIRVRQWYKNFLVFMALIFSGNLFGLEPVLISIMSFVSLCLVSSSYYIINDLKDLTRDRIHPEKKHRPLASGKIKVWQAVSFIILFLVSSLIIAWQVNYQFFIIIVVMFIISQLYTFALKRILFADFLTISILFVIRAISGALAIKVYISPWLVLCPFFLAMFLVVGKRRADLILLRNNENVKTIKNKGILTDYSLDLTNSLMNISTALLVISYSLYCFFSEQSNLMYTLPFALYVIFHYFGLVLNGSVIARQPEKVIKDKYLVIGILLWTVFTISLVYFMR